MNVMLQQIAGKALLALPGAIVLTVAEKEIYAKEIVNQIRQEGANITDAEAKMIIDKVLANPQLVQQNLEKLNRAISALL